MIYIIINQGKLNNSQMWLLLFSARSYTELYKLANKIMNEKDASRFMEEMEKLNSDDFILSQWEQKQLDQMVRDNELKYAKEDGRNEGMKQGLEQGIEENRIEIAKEMIKDNIDIATISKYTHLSKEEIEKQK